MVRNKGRNNRRPKRGARLAKYISRISQYAPTVNSGVLAKIPSVSSDGIRYTKVRVDMALTTVAEDVLVKDEAYPQFDARWMLAAKTRTGTYISGGMAYKAIAELVRNKYYHSKDINHDHLWIAPKSVAIYLNQAPTDRYRILEATIGVTSKASSYPQIAHCTFVPNKVAWAKSTVSELSWSLMKDAEADTTSQVIAYVTLSEIGAKLVTDSNPVAAQLATIDVTMAHGYTTVGGSPAESVNSIISIGKHMSKAESDLVAKLGLLKT